MCLIWVMKFISNLAFTISLIIKKENWCHSQDFLILTEKWANSLENKSGASLGHKVIKLFSCSTKLISKFILLINVKMPTVVGILTFISRINDWLLWFKPAISIDFGYFSIYEQLKFHAQLSWEREKFYNLWARSVYSIPPIQISAHCLLTGWLWALCSSMQKKIGDFTRHIWATTRENRSSGFPTGSDTNQAAQSLNIARDLKFLI